MNQSLDGLLLLATPSWPPRSLATYHAILLSYSPWCAMIARFRVVLAVLVALAILISSASAGQDFRGQIQPGAELGHLLNLGPNTRVLLHAVPPQPPSSGLDAEPRADSKPAVDGFGDGLNRSLNLAAFGQQRDRSTLVAVDGSFIFRDLEQGAYTLEVVSRTHIFEQYRIDIPDPATGKAPQIRIFTP